jgi:hypothetical protein
MLPDSFSYKFMPTCLPLDVVSLVLPIFRILRDTVIRPRFAIGRKNVTDKAVAVVTRNSLFFLGQSFEGMDEAVETCVWIVCDCGWCPNHLDVRVRVISVRGGGGGGGAAATCATLAVFIIV